VKRYAMYLSFSGGPALDSIEKEFGSRMARALHCSVDPDLYFPKPCEGRFDLGYMGTYSDDRQPVLDRLMLQAARRNPDAKMIVAGPQYPATIEWPPNVMRITHLSPQEHCAFYNSQRFTLNITRREMVRMGYSPSVRLFEAAACGTPIISDNWNGLDTFFKPQHEILLARSANDTLKYLASISESERAAIGKHARRRVLREHTAAHRAIELEQYTREASALLH
jgi:spore maturation protein CgeB